VQYQLPDRLHARHGGSRLLTCVTDDADDRRQLAKQCWSIRRASNKILKVVVVIVVTVMVLVVVVVVVLLAVFVIVCAHLPYHCTQNLIFYFQSAHPLSAAQLA